jgi:hypothetical protein
MSTLYKFTIGANIKGYINKEKLIQSIQTNKGFADTYPGERYLPALLITYESGQPKAIYHAKNGLLHSYNDEPALVIYNPDGGIELKLWLKEGQFYERENGKHNYKSHLIKYKTRKWCMPDSFKPRQIRIGSNFFLIHTRIICNTTRNKKFHRDPNVGPAVIVDKGKRISKLFYNNGEFIKKEVTIC